jgi:hypothetical protein
MRRGALTIVLVSCCVLCSPAATAAAAPQAEFILATDGTVVLVGTGWHPAQELVISLGGGRIVAYTDASGEFELSTGLPAYPGGLSIHRSSFVTPPSNQIDAPHPYAVLFAQALAKGVLLLAVAAGALLSLRPLFRRQR